MSSLGSALGSLGRHKEAITKHKEAVRLAELSIDATPEAVFEVRTNLASALSKAGEIAVAAEEQERLVSLCPQIEPQPGQKTLNVHLNLGVTLSRLSRYDKAQTHLEHVLRLCADAPLNDSILLRVRNSLAHVYAQQGQLERAEVEYRDLVKVQMDLHPIDETQPNIAAHPDVLLMQNNFGSVLQRRGRYAEAIET